PADRLPAGYERRYRQPSFWDQYRWRIMAVVVAVAAETALLIALLVERRQRRRAQDESRQRRRELAQAARLATIGQLAAAISPATCPRRAGTRSPSSRSSSTWP